AAAVGEAGPYRPAGREADEIATLPGFHHCVDNRGGFGRGADRPLGRFDGFADQQIRGLGNVGDDVAQSCNRAGDTAAIFTDLARQRDAAFGVALAVDQVEREFDLAHLAGLTYRTTVEAEER